MDESNEKSQKHENGGPPLHGGRREEAARRYGIPREELLDFSASINLLGPSPAAVGAVRSALQEMAHYPAEDGGRLLSVLATRLGAFPDEIVPGNGSIEVIYWLAAALQPRKVLIVEPTFSEYRRACEAAGAECDSFLLKEEEGFALQTSRLDPAGYDLVFVCNPNNPTGYVVSADEIAALWKRCHEAGAGLVVDEAFIEFAGEDESILSYGTAADLYVLRSLTKAYALAGLRLGCLVAEAGFAAWLKERMPPWNINAFALAAGEASLNDIDYIFRTREETADERRRFFNDLAATPGIEPLPSETNFILCRLKQLDSATVADRLARVGILVRDCRSFTGLGDRYIRVAVRSRQENYQLLAALGRLMRGDDVVPPRRTSPADTSPEESSNAC